MRLLKRASFYSLIAFALFADVYPPLQHDITILSSDASGLILEIDVPEPRIQKSNVSNVSGSFLSINGYSYTIEPGKPMLLRRGIPVAIPPDAQPSLRILQIDEQSKFVGDIPPAPTFVREGQNPDAATVQRYQKDHSAYRANRFAPEDNLHIGAESTMRDLDICSIVFQPVRYNPVTRTIKYVTKIRFAVDFNAAHKRQNLARVQRSPAFQTLFSKSLLNYEQSKNWAIPRPRLQKLSASFLDEGQTWFKIFTDKAGIFQIRFSDLKNAGFENDIDPEKIRLFNMGEEVALRLATDNDGEFNNDDVIEFYAQQFKNDYTAHNIYWLTVADESGKRMQPVDGAPSDNSPVLSFGQHELLHEKDFFHVANFPDHTDQEHWYMDSLFAPASKTYQFDLGTIARDNDSNATLAFSMLGYAAQLNVKPDHHTIININGEQIFETYWDGRVTLSETAEFANSILRDGINDIEFVAPGDTENEWLDWQVIDFFHLFYQRENSVHKDSLAVRISQNGRYTIKTIGLSDDDISIYDITNAHNPLYITGAKRQDGQLNFEYSTADTDFMIVSDTYKNHPVKIVKDSNSNWRDVNHHADHIILTFDDFYPDLAPLANFHQANGLSVQVVKVQDVYDEFGYGIYGMSPIKRFLSHAYDNWATRPSFVLFVGDASWNPRRLRPELESYGAGVRTDFIPTRLFETSVEHGQGTSDSWFACFDGRDDVLPEMMVGRLPARSRLETQYMVHKLLNYATRFEPGAWQNTATFVADVGDGGANAFEDSSDAYIQNYIPNDFTANRLYLSELGMPQTKNKIYESFAQGCLTLNYFGHGAVHLWSQEKVFSNDDVPNLDENINLPFVYTMSCINGYFADPSPNGSSLGELLLRAESKGALAVFTGSGKAFASTLQPLTNGLYHSLYTERNPIIGAFSNAGLVRMHSTFPNSTDHVQFYVLFGDPATRLHYTPAGDERQYAWFSGTIDYKGTLPPPKSQLDAFIDKQKYSSFVLDSDDATFGPIYIPADDPATRERDGGVEGDSASFKLVLADSTSYDVHPKVLWKQGGTENVTLFVEGNRVDASYHIDFYVDQSKVGEQFFDGDPVNSTATIYAEIKNVHSALNSNFDVFLNGEKIESERITISPFDAVEQKRILTFTPENLQDGEYEFQVHTDSDRSETQRHSFRFSMSSSLKLNDVVNFPNPFVDGTRFTFMLHNDGAAEVSVKIYTVSGRLIQKITSFADVGYNEIVWDGCDAFGDKLANGVYFYKISANDGVEHVEKIERLVVMQ